jgi:hypothetical protein
MIPAAPERLGWRAKYAEISALFNVTRHHGHSGQSDEVIGFQ